MLTALVKRFGGSNDVVQEDQSSNVAIDGEAEIFCRDESSDVLGTDIDRDTMRNDLNNRRRDLVEIKSQIRAHWTTYKENLQAVKHESGIDELDAKTKAAEAKKAAKDKEQLFKLLYQEYSALKNALRKDETIRMISGNRYEVGFSEMNTASVESRVQEYQEELSRAENTVKNFNKQMNRADHEVELDFSDLEKDISELEMDASEVEENLEIVVEDPDPELEAGQEVETGSSIDKNWD